MLTITGKPVYGAISIGPLALFHRNTISTAARTITDPEAEVQRFQSAREEAAAQLGQLYEKALETVGEEDAAIFEIHQMMLEDDEYIEGVESHIREEVLNAEAAVDRTAQELAAMFRGMDDEYMQGRAADVLDISRRVEQILSGGPAIDFSQYDQVILAADDLVPSETMQLDTKKILGFVLSGGSASSHTAILARNLGIATVVNTGTQIHTDLEGKMAVVNGFTGNVYLDPDEATLAAMQEKQKQAQAERERLENVRGKESVTQDGQKVLIYANAGNPADLPRVVASDAEGIGLFRSEFLYLENDDYPTEEQQFEAYKKALTAMEGKRVVIRTMDIGADKKADYFDLDPEENPAMGLRAIRICLTRPELFKTQLRALCRASVYGRLAIMFPMIISVEEVRKAKALLAEVMAQLKKEGIPCAEQIETGIMIETPAAALVSDALAEEVDFFSLGTNDLTQYTLAIDRQQTKLDDFFDPHHLAVLRLIEMTAKNAHKAGIWVGICGELGADLSLTEAFLRMGIDELSVSATSVLPLRDKVRSLNLKA
ncbi:phosphoenolpyruvate--protein phosphotransferase [Succiniclasticum ruminis]|uniref:Phosphoenolpyruvate-protein phosphotransferase n=1 Tax=Succiniclasticum ruminis DSM 9236 TaxID=1123323 RepID=A0A1I2AN67_9FIRM|nr:phosphoenolpyruvate--protein phosphotransferase [Succiniclasticum ruminis]SFE45137.1 phosphoenolpyruvate--protein phosphotransferase [Succiniclasticum ruminis DSM 9236]